MGDNDNRKNDSVTELSEAESLLVVDDDKPGPSGASPQKRCGRAMDKGELEVDYDMPGPSGACPRKIRGRAMDKGELEVDYDKPGPSGVSQHKRRGAAMDKENPEGENVPESKRRKLIEKIIEIKEKKFGKSGVKRKQDEDPLTDKDVSKTHKRARYDNKIIVLSSSSEDSEISDDYLIQCLNGVATFSRSFDNLGYENSEDEVFEGKKTPIEVTGVVDEVLSSSEDELTVTDTKVDVSLERQRIVKAGSSRTDGRCLGTVSNLTRLFESSLRKDVNDRQLLPPSSSASIPDIILASSVYPDQPLGPFFPPPPSDLVKLSIVDWMARMNRATSNTPDSGAVMTDPCSSSSNSGSIIDVVDHPETPPPAETQSSYSVQEMPDIIPDDKKDPEENPISSIITYDNEKQSQSRG